MYAGLRDTWQLIRPYLRPSRAWNAFLVRFSFNFTRLLGRPVHWGMPVAVSVEPTTACNLGCPHCPSGINQFTRPTGKMIPEQFISLIREVAPYSGYVTLYFQGEPYIHKAFTDMVETATDAGMYTATSTNAHFLTPLTAEATVKAGLKRMIISIDGITQESYARYRINGNLEKVLEGTKNILAARKKLGKKHPVIIWQFIVFAHNEHEVPALKKLAAEYGVDKLAMKTAQIYDYANADDWLPADLGNSRYEKVNGEVVLKNNLLNHCWRLWSNPVITWDGRLVPCCFDKDATHDLGNVLDNGTGKVWHGAEAAAFRQKLVGGRSEIDICRNCTEGSRVWI